MSLQIDDNVIKKIEYTLNNTVVEEFNKFDLNSNSAIEISSIGRDLLFSILTHSQFDSTKISKNTIIMHDLKNLLMIDNGVIKGGRYFRKTVKKRKMKGGNPLYFKVCKVNAVVKETGLLDFFIKFQEVKETAKPFYVSFTYPKLVREDKIDNPICQGDVLPLKESIGMDILKNFVKQAIFFEGIVKQIEKKIDAKQNAVPLAILFAKAYILGIPVENLSNEALKSLYLSAISTMPKKGGNKLLLFILLLILLSSSAVSGMRYDTTSANMQRISDGYKMTETNSNTNNSPLINTNQIILNKEFQTLSVLDLEAKINEMIKKGANINNEDSNGMTMLSYAINNNVSVEKIKLLLKNGADPNTIYNGNSVLSIAINNKNKDVVQALIANNANVNLANTKGITPLMFACKNPRMDIISDLTEAHANVNAQDNDGNTALHYALDENALYFAFHAWHISEPIIEELLKQNADMNIKNNSGKTPLDILIDYGKKSYWFKLANIKEIQQLFDKYAKQQIVTENQHQPELVNKNLLSSNLNSLSPRLKNQDVFLHHTFPLTLIPNATVTSNPNATDTSNPNATDTSNPNATDTSNPNATVTSNPNATDTSNPNATVTSKLNATKSDKNSTLLFTPQNATHSVFLNSALPFTLRPVTKTLPDGTVFNGTLALNGKLGDGTLTYANNSEINSLSGDFENGFTAGDSYYVRLKDGSTYKGPFNDKQKADGRGVYVSLDGYTIFAEWKDGVMGKIEKIEKNGIIYKIEEEGKKVLVEDGDKKVSGTYSILSNKDGSLQIKLFATGITDKDGNQLVVDSNKDKTARVYDKNKITMIEGRIENNKFVPKQTEPSPYDAIRKIVSDEGEILANIVYNSFLSEEDKKTISAVQKHYNAQVKDIYKGSTTFIDLQTLAKMFAKEMGPTIRPPGGKDPDEIIFRKGITSDILSRTTIEFVDELPEHIEDPRWFKKVQFRGESYKESLTKQFSVTIDGQEINYSISVVCPSNQCWSHNIFDSERPFNVNAHVKILVERSGDKTEEEEAFKKASTEIVKKKYKDLLQIPSDNIIEFSTTSIPVPNLGIPFPALYPITTQGEPTSSLSVGPVGKRGPADWDTTATSMQTPSWLNNTQDPTNEDANKKKFSDNKKNFSDNEKEFYTVVTGIVLIALKKILDIKPWTKIDILKRILGIKVANKKRGVSTNNLGKSNVSNPPVTAKNNEIDWVEPFIGNENSYPSLEQIKSIFDNNHVTDVNIENSFSMTAFIFQSYYYKLDAMTWLLEKGANINKQDVFGNTALYYATYNCNYDEVVFLLSNKAKQLKNQNNMTPLDYAKSLITSETPSDYKDIINKIISKMEEVLLIEEQAKAERLAREATARETEARAQAEKAEADRVARAEADRVARAEATANAEANPNANILYKLSTNDIEKLNTEMNDHIIPTLVRSQQILEEIKKSNGKSVTLTEYNTAIETYKQEFDHFLTQYNPVFTKIFMDILPKVVKKIQTNTTKEEKKKKIYTTFVKHCNSIKELLSTILKELYNRSETFSNNAVDTNIKTKIEMITSSSPNQILGGFNATHKLKNKVGKPKKTKKFKKKTRK